MKFLKNKKTKVIASLLIVFALVLIFIQGGEKSSDYLRKAGDSEKTLYSQSEKNKSKKADDTQDENAEANEFEITDDENNKNNENHNDDYEFWADDGGEYDGYTEKYYPYEENTSASNVQADMAVDDDNQNATAEALPEGDYCFLSVRCDALLDNMSRLEKSKRGIVPSDGVIYPKRAVSFSDGESVFDVLQREMRDNKIHLEFVNTPVYNSVYVEGIANLYEFDCGSGSGWIYRVNGVVPGYGCSNYKLCVGDVVEFLYTCNLGKDIE